MFKFLKKLFESPEMQKQTQRDVQGTIRMTTRGGKSVPVDCVNDAHQRGDLEEMLSVLHVDTHPIDRHFLLSKIVESTYQKRTNPEMRKKCKEIAELHLGEIPTIIPELRMQDGFLPNISTFKYYAIVLTEDKEFSRAIEVCNIALHLGIHDGTKGDFAGRIERIKKARDKCS